MAPPKWVPLESNPDVMNDWAFRAGLIASQAHFEDVYGLDDELLDMIPQPVKAVILLFPLTEECERRYKEEDATLVKQTPVDPTILFIKQTINNACGTMGLLHALANSDVTFAPESVLEKLIGQCQGKTPIERAHVLETTPLLEEIHATTAAEGQSAVPPNLDTDLHFTCFVAAPEYAARESETPTRTMRLIELDGERAGPVDRGECKDLLRDTAKYVKTLVASSESLQFNMMALVGHSEAVLDGHGSQ